MTVVSCFFNYWNKVRNTYVVLFYSSTTIQEVCFIIQLFWVSLKIGTRVNPEIENSLGTQITPKKNLLAFLQYFWLESIYLTLGKINGQKKIITRKLSM